MAKNSPEFCWHHSNLKRLRQCLDKNYCDLYGGERGIKWYKRHKLYEGMPVRFSVKGKVVAFGTIQSGPYDLSGKKGISPVDPEWPGAVDIHEDKTRQQHAGECRSCPRWGSHRL